MSWLCKLPKRTLDFALDVSTQADISEPRQTKETSIQRRPCIQGSGSIFWDPVDTTEVGKPKQAAALDLDCDNIQGELPLQGSAACSSTPWRRSVRGRIEGAGIEIDLTSGGPDGRPCIASTPQVDQCHQNICTSISGDSGISTLRRLPWDQRQPPTPLASTCARESAPQASNSQASSVFRVESNDAWSSLRATSTRPSAPLVQANNRQAISDFVVEVDDAQSSSRPAAESKPSLSLPVTLPLRVDGRVLDTREVEILSQSSSTPSAPSGRQGLMMRREARLDTRPNLVHPTLTPSQQLATKNDLELAMLLQLQEQGVSSVNVGEEVPLASQQSDRLPSNRWLLVVEPSTSNARCRGCSGRIRRQDARALFQCSGQRQPVSAHVGCLVLISDVVLPIRGAGEMSHASSSSSSLQAHDWQVMLSPQLSSQQRVQAAEELAKLPVGHSTLRHFTWPPIPRAVRVPRGSDTQRMQQLQMTNRDFTADDYEMLLELDADDQATRDAKQLHAETLLSRLPVSTVAEGSAGTQCSICLESMATGEEVRTLPCLHIFHRKCIDRWLVSCTDLRCPIDQVEIDGIGGQFG